MQEKMNIADDVNDSSEEEDDPQQAAIADKLALANQAKGTSTRDSNSANSQKRLTFAELDQQLPEDQEIVEEEEEEEEEA